MILNWMRKIPHPTYGLFCGQKANGSAFGKNIPVDALDACCYEHDKNCFEAEKLNSLDDILNSKDKADYEFAIKLRTNLKPFKYKIWGAIYQNFARMIFRPRRDK